jgi:hypothetical protein
VKESWHLFVPPILTLLDDPSTSIRHRGLLTLTSFLPKLTARLLTQTGLDSVFEDAITPTLLYLPNLTPLEESLLLLPAAYAALFTLCNVRYPLPPSSPASDSNLNPNPKEKEKVKAAEIERERLKFLDRTMRDGIIQGYTHASTHPAIVEILVQQLRTLVQKMGVHSVKHLKDIIPILSAVMTDPFAVSRSSLLLEAVRTTEVVVLNTWPRMREEGHRVEVIRALVLCWKTISDEEGEMEGLAEVKREISVAGRLLVSAVEGEVDMRSELEPIMDVDAGLIEGVFGITGSEDKE